ncbi:MAG: DHH family phosphoesterase [Acidobacteria bacterium]|jgi:nanoRNase/pAp phosphatase (c-di-AMP/oligoRNAs hydrolase)|nr:DHH family phosphoesterase [Acidobacteriota bacterium]
MRNVIVTQSVSHATLLMQAMGLPPADLLFVVESVELERYLRRRGCGVVRGSLRSRETYRQALPAQLLAISLRDVRRLRGVLEAVGRERGDTPVMVLSVPPLETLPTDPEAYPWAFFVPVASQFQAAVKTDMRLARARVRVRRLREVVGDTSRALILLQDDPDPDGIASGLALRTLLGRNRSTMPMASFGKVTRPENIAMLDVLDIEIREIRPEDLSQWDRVVMVDVQPPHLRRPLPRVDVVIDHHPAQTTYEARYIDVRNHYGATATILLEYLRAEGIKVNERLATAMLYAIRTDTLLLDRPVTDADVEAFTYLYARANINWIRKIERPALPRETLVSFAQGLQNARIEDKVLFSHLGPVRREDIVPQLADFCLQVEGVDWSAVSGVFENELIISVRNVGFVQKAGTAVKAAYSEFGSAGGHRSMAKAVLPLARLPLPVGPELYRLLEDRLLAVLRGAPPTSNG